MYQGKKLSWIIAIGLACSSSVFANLTPPVDASNRVVRGSDHNPINYYSSPAKSPNVATNRNKALIPRYQEKSKAAAPFAEVWRLANWGTGIGATGIHPINLDGDNKPELVLGGGSGYGANAFWSVARFNSSNQGYDIVWQSAVLNDDGASVSLTSMLATDLEGKKRVWIGRGDGKIEIQNLITREQEYIRSMATTDAIVDLAFADVDHDGVAEIIALSNNSTYLLDPETGSLKRTVSIGADTFAVGNVDDDTELEIILNTGRVIQLTTSSYTTEWNSATRFGALVELADIDGDNRQEIVAAEDWYKIRAYDAETRSSKWEHTANLDIQALLLKDVTGDGVAEVLYGDGQWGSIYALDANSRAELWSANNPEHGVTDVALIDTDGDGDDELLWGAGWSSSGPDHLYVYDLFTRTRVWESKDVVGPYQAVAIGNLDAIVGDEIVVSSWKSSSGYDDGVISIFDADSREPIWTSTGNLFGGQAWTGIHDLRIANVDNDPQAEIIVTTDRLYDGAIYVIDGLTYTKQQSHFFDSGSPLYAMEVADVTGDSVPEVIAGAGREHTGSPGTYLYVIDPISGAVIWKSVSLTNNWTDTSDVAVADVGSSGIDLLAVNGSLHRVIWSSKQHNETVDADYLSVTAADVLGTGKKQILAGTNSGQIRVIDGDTLATIQTYSICTEAILALQVESPTVLLGTCGTSLFRHDFTSNSTERIDSGIATLGQGGSLAVGVMDGKNGLIVGGNYPVAYVNVGNNQLPLVQAASFTAHWRGISEFNISGSDPDGDALSFELFSLPSNGTLSWVDAKLGRLLFTSNASGRSSSSFSVRAFDGLQYSTPVAMTLTLTNAVPIATAQPLSVHWRGTQTVVLYGTDPDDDPLKSELIATPTHATTNWENKMSGRLLLTPSGAMLGADSLSYRVTDGTDTSVTRTVAITYTNTAPVVQSETFALTNGVAVQSRIRASDANADPLTYELVTPPTIGEFTVEATTGLFKYVPKNGGTGRDSVTVQVFDGVSRSTTATLQFDYPTASNNSGGGGGGGSSVPALILLLLASTLYRRKSQGE